MPQSQQAHQHPTLAAHTHHHAHHHGHHHHFSTLQLLLAGIALILVFALVEAIGAWWSGSLVLLSDAGHMVSDAVALMLAAFAAWIARRPPSYKHSYGLGRAEVVAAWLSSLFMLIISIAILVSAILRIHHPESVQGHIVIVIAILGLIVNLFLAWLLAHDQSTLNTRAALLHVMSDMLGSIAALVAGSVIYFTHWQLIDPILSILISILIMVSSLKLLRESLLVLMEGVPGHIDIRAVSDNMVLVRGVKAVHDLHVWTLSSGVIALSAHINIEDLANWDEILQGVLSMLKQNYGIEHVTLQPEFEKSSCQPCVLP